VVSFVLHAFVGGWSSFWLGLLHLTKLVEGYERRLRVTAVSPWCIHEYLIFLLMLRWYRKATVDLILHVLDVLVQDILDPFLFGYLAHLRKCTHLELDSIALVINAGRGCHQLKVRPTNYRCVKSSRQQVTLPTCAGLLMNHSGVSRADLLNDALLVREGWGATRVAVLMRE